MQSAPRYFAKKSRSISASERWIEGRKPDSVQVAALLKSIDQGIAVYDAEIAPALAGSLSERRQIELYGDAEQNRVYSLATERNQY